MIYMILRLYVGHDNVNIALFIGGKTFVVNVNFCFM